MNENVDYVAKTPSKSTRFLWWCAGADEKILEYCSYSDHVKYSGIGGVVLATAFMAALSMGFALNTIFGGKTYVWFITIPIALIWALIVFNLDRFIVSSTGKGDGESTISWQELGNATPRLLMAILLGLTISAPLETTIFDTEIQREWNDTKYKLSQSRMEELKIANRTTGEVGKITAKVKTDSANLVRMDADKSKKEQMISDLLTGANGSEKCVAGENCPRHHSMYVQAALATKLRDSTAKVLNQNVMELEKAQALDEDKIQKAGDSVLTQPAGFLDKIMMLENLSAHAKMIPKYDPITEKPIKGEEQEITGSAFWAIWLVRLLFMIIEIAPVILKLMLIKSPYDYMGENINQILEAKQGISMNHLTDEKGNLTKYKENFNPKRIIAIVEHQNLKEEENAKEAITLFAEKEKKEIEKNPEAFINPDVDQDQES